MKFLTFFKKIKNSFSGLGSNPLKDWFLLLALFAFFFVTSVTFHAVVFFAVDSSDQVVATSTSSVLETLDRERLKNVLKKIDERITNGVGAEESIQKLSDPSL